MPSLLRCSLPAVAAAVLLAGCGQTAPSAAPGGPSGSVPAPTSAAGSGGATPGATASATPPSVTASATATPSASQPQPAPQQLPRGGTDLFPAYRLFGYSGYPGAPGQGRLGIGRLDDRMKEIEQRGKAWLGGRKLLPVMELIAVTVHGSPGRDGMFRSRTDEAIIKRWHDAAVKHKALLLLNIQPGRADFIDEVKFFEKWLKYPNVGVALDPEWAVNKGQVPGRVYGSTSGKELNDVAAYLSGLVAANGLPEKVMLFHQLHVNIVKRPKDLKTHPGVAQINSVDGIGSPGAKVATYQRVIKTRPPHVHAGFKLFYVEDVNTGRRLMTPREVLRLKPQPEYVLFE